MGGSDIIVPTKKLIAALREAGASAVLDVLAAKNPLEPYQVATLRSAIKRVLGDSYGVMTDVMVEYFVNGGAFPS